MIGEGVKIVNNNIVLFTEHNNKTKITNKTNKNNKMIELAAGGWKGTGEGLQVKQSPTRSYVTTENHTAYLQPIDSSYSFSSIIWNKKKRTNNLLVALEQQLFELIFELCKSLFSQINWDRISYFNSLISKLNCYLATRRWKLFNIQVVRRIWSRLAIINSWCWWKVFGYLGMKYLLRVLMHYFGRFEWI